MGIPLYFRFLTEKYPDTIKDVDDTLLTKHQLFFDLNGMIHPCCSKVRRNILSNNNGQVTDKSQFRDISTKTFQELTVGIERIIRLVNPTESATLCVDGVAPLAKINQQRSRRYKSHILTKLINQVKQEEGEVTDTWDTNAISPGTQFMSQLMGDLTKYVQQVNNTPEANDIQCKLELSTSNEAGEGEHKIFRQIRDAKSTRVRVVYGLDADLIMLSLISGKSNIYLLRESVHFGKVDPDKFLMLDIDSLKRAICSEFRGFLTKGESVSEAQIIRDYLFLCFLIGNDFVPHMPMLHISDGSVDYLLEIYAEVMRETDNSGLISEDGVLHLEAFTQLTRRMAQDEDEMVTSFYNSYRRKRYGEKPGLTPLQSAIRKLEYMPLTRMTRDTICYNKPNWEGRYYRRFLCQETVRPADIDNMCRNYCLTLVWIFRYYSSGCPNWHWFYKYACCPTAKDIYRYLTTKPDIANYQFQLSRPVSADEQMLSILPPGSIDLLPDHLQSLMKSDDSPIRDFYPNSFNIEMSYMRFFHETIPQLPPIEIGRIQDAVQWAQQTKQAKDFPALIPVK